MKMGFQVLVWAVVISLLGFGDHNTTSGAPAPITTLVSVSSSGAQATVESWSPSVSGDGRYVAFYTVASNLVPNDTNGTLDVFVRDRQTKVTTRASVDSSGNQANGGSGNPAITPDGRFVAFSSSATNLVSEPDLYTCGGTPPSSCSDAFVHDRQTGITTRESVASTGAQANSNIGFVSISVDGRFVAFDSHATNLVPGDTNDCGPIDPPGNCSDVFVRDRLLGTTTRVSVDSNGVQGNDDSRTSRISADGRFVVFDSEATNLVPGDTNGVSDTFVHDRQTGLTTRVSVSSTGEEANGASGGGHISSDGRIVAFVSSATNLVPGNPNPPNAFVHDRQTGLTSMVSVDSLGNPGIRGESVGGISSDGRFVVMQSDSENLVPGDTNDLYDIFVHDRLTGGTTRVNVTSTGAEAKPDNSFHPSISGDGRIVAFISKATNLVSGDTNGIVQDIYAHDRTGFQCDGMLGTIIGTPAANIINGSSGPDVILGLSGNDAINGFAGDDRICGGNSKDTLNGGDGNDRLFADSGQGNILNGGLGNDYLKGGPANDFLNGNDGNDTLLGDRGDDVMDGGPQTDTCNGGTHISGDTAVNCETVIGVP